MNKLSEASYSAIYDAICNQLNYLGGGEQYDLLLQALNELLLNELLQALNELNAIYYGEEVNNND